MTEKLIIFILVALLYFDFKTVKQDKKSKKVYLIISIPAVYLLFSYITGMNLPNLDEIFYFILGPAAEAVLSWLQVK
ncbi:hypothetical protein QUF49_17595 [Fictibacillus sp. b24]|uniref:hypothetical protein n=1 Tax=Fictibacillus sp. b24 TaxID=3055863 RepID=UPI0025A2D868|nr:hypothetical protein [Fictibacillus sp. b24]MDM5317829.1 hypothetical protein [Fictibacillus sp. b24]